MIAVRAPDGTLDVYLRADEAGAVQHAITQARPCGSAATPDGRVRVHVSADAAPDLGAPEPTPREPRT